MIKTNYSGLDVWLLNLEPDWDESVNCDLSLMATADAGLSNREARRAFSESLRLVFRYGIFAIGKDARRLTGALRQIKKDPVAVPFWPAAVRWTDRATRPIGGGLNLAFKEDFSQWEIYEDVEPGWPAADDQVAPLLWGRLKRKETEWQGPDKVAFPVEFTEEGPADWAIMPAAAAFDAGPALAGYGTAPKLFPFGVNFTSVRSSIGEVVLREQLGFTREERETFYPQTPAREQKAEHFLGDAADIANVLEFFRQHGAGRSFWVPDYVSAVVLQEDVGAADTVLQVEDTEAVVTGDWIVFSNPHAVLGFGRINAKTGDTVTLAAAPGVDIPASALVSFLVLAKLKAPKLALKWDTLEKGSIAIPMLELPTEYAPAADESLGETIGLLPTRCYLYEFSRTLSGVPYVDRYTSYEADLNFDDQVWESKKITHGEIAQGLQVDQNEVEVKSDLFAGSALALMATLKMEAPLQLVIRQAEVSGAGEAVNDTIIFTGDIVKVSPEGSKITGKAVSGGIMFDRLVPTWSFQRDCNVNLFSVACGLSKAAWKFAAVIQDAGDEGYPFEFVLEQLQGVGPSAIAALAADEVGETFFALGYIEIGTGENWQTRAVLLSSDVAAGVLTVTLDRDPDPFPEIGDDVILYPGCDLTFARCKALGNEVNFTGHPFMPLANPSVIQSNSGSGGGKK